MGRTVKGIYNAAGAGGKKEAKRKRGKRKVPALTNPRNVERPYEVVFDSKQRRNYVTGFRKRKEKRRVRAAKCLLVVQKEIAREQRATKRQEENERLISAGLMQDPLQSFLVDGDSEDSGSDSNDNASDSGSTTASQTADVDLNQTDTYESEALVTTVITSVPTAVDTHSDLLEETRRSLKEEKLSALRSDNGRGDFDDRAKSIVDRQFAHSALSADSASILDADLVMEPKRKPKKTKEEKKQERVKVKKMMAFVKEFNRRKKRRANSKRKKSGKSKSKGKTKGKKRGKR